MPEIKLQFSDCYPGFTSSEQDILKGAFNVVNRYNCFSGALYNSPALAIYVQFDKFNNMVSG